MADQLKKPFHETVAEKLIEQLKRGTAPWQHHWKAGEPSGFLPYNSTTGKRYKGINAIHLLAQSRKDQRWMTYKQAAAAGAQVRKGERSTVIQYWKFTEEKIKRDENGQLVLDTNGEPVKKTVTLERPRMFCAYVFNAEQIDGLPPTERKPQTWTLVERAERILNGSSAAIYHAESDHAFYRLETDTIHLPNRSQFSTADNYYATALHELGHWTGHHTRLARDLAHPFGSEGYAKEELRAEIASMILGDELGIGHAPEQHAAYVGSWIKALQDDPLEIFRAAADAEKIQGYVLAFEQKQVQETAHSADLEYITKQAERDDSKRQYLAVPFGEREVARAAGAAWDRAAKSWYVGPNGDMGKLKRWLPDNVPNVQSKRDDSKRQYLAVPFGEREAARAAGAAWDRAVKSWYVGPNGDMGKLKRWLPDNAPNAQGPAMMPEEEFAEALRAMGCTVSGEHPIMDGKPHRVLSAGDKGNNHKIGSGFYVAHMPKNDNEVPAGYIKNNRTGIEMRWKAKGYVLDDAARAKLNAEAAEKLQARAVAEARMYARAVERVKKQAAELVPVENPTPYMEAKGIQPQQGAYTDREGMTTYLPAVDVDGKQWSMQYISADGTKRFAKDSRKEGCFHPIGGLEVLAQAPALVIGEGYATMSSVAQTLGFATVAAFDSGNLKSVAEALHAKFPDKPVIITGDNDIYLELSEKRNPGKVKAQEAARAVGGTAIFPIFALGEQAENPKGFTDFNDLATRSVLGQDGLERQVKGCVNDMITKRQVAIEQQPQELVQAQQIKRPPRGQQIKERRPVKISG